MEEKIMNLIPTKKQIGIIFKNWKENNIKLEEEDIKRLYRIADYHSPDYYNNNNIYLDNVMKAIQFLFDNNFKEAQQRLNFALKF